jgi:hypothetical protein
MWSKRINATKHIVEAKGLQESRGSIEIEGSHAGAESRIGRMLRSGSNTWLNLTTVDDEVERLGLHVGFIKADIEGHELRMLRGARKTIREQRPILSLAIYHGAQLYEVPEWIRRFGGYRLEFRQECASDRKSRGEPRLLAIPDLLPSGDRGVGVNMEQAG